MVIEMDSFFRNYQETDSVGESVELSPGLPSWFKGDVILSGNGKFHFEETNFSVVSLQDGYALITKISIEGGRATIRKKFQQSEALRKAEAAGRTVLSECYTPSSQDVTKSRLGRMFSLLPECSDNGAHIVYKLGDHVFISNGLANFDEIDTDELTTIKRFDSRKLFGSVNFSAHPLVEKDGTMFNIATCFGAMGGKLAVLRIPPPGKTTNVEDCIKQYKTIASVPMPRLSQSNVHHSFGMSENYIITIEQPFWANIKKFANNVFMGNSTTLMSVMEWAPEAGVGNKFYVVDKRNGKLVKTVYQSDNPFFVIHVGPCFERTFKGKDGLVTEIVMDLISYKNSDITESIHIENLKERRHLPCSKDGFYQRYILPLQGSVEKDIHHGTPTGQNEINTFSATSRLVDTPKGQTLVEVTPGTFSKGGIASQVMNPKFQYQNYRYTYGPAGFNFDSEYYGKLVKFDMKTGEEVAVWESKDSFAIAEPIFVPNPSAGNKEEDEDDGILMVGVFYTEATRNSLVFIDPKSMTEISRATFQNAIPPYCHPLYLPRS